MDINKRNAIVIKNLRKEFGNKVAVKDINLKIKEGELFALLGVNGAGKTTTIKILTGLSRPTSGNATVGGFNILEELENVKKIAGISLQETAIAPNLTVEENLKLMAEIYEIDKIKLKARIENIINQFSLEEIRKSKCKTLSGGWQRRLSIAMALISEPKVLFLDEPTLGLDVLARRKLWGIIEGLKSKITIILTTHYMEEAQMLADRVAVMVDGEIMAVGSVEELERLTGEASLENAFIAIAEGGNHYEE